MPMTADRRGFTLSVMSPAGMPEAYMPMFAASPWRGETLGAMKREERSVR